MLRDLHAKGWMPTFSNGALTGVTCPFVNPLDPEGNIQCLAEGSEDTPNAQLVKQKIEAGLLVDADVWLAVQVRRGSLTDFMIALVEKYEQRCPTKSRPVPNFMELLRAGQLERDMVNRLSAAKEQEKKQAAPPPTEAPKK
jgi:hypothetical protein